MSFGDRLARKMAVHRLNSVSTHDGRYSLFRNAVVDVVSLILRRCCTLRCEGAALLLLMTQAIDSLIYCLFTGIFIVILLMPAFLRYVYQQLVTFRTVRKAIAVSKYGKDTWNRSRQEPLVQMTGRSWSIRDYDPIFIQLMQTCVEKR